MEKEWLNLHKQVMDKIKTEKISPFIKVGNTGCLIETANNIYIGLDIMDSNNISSNSLKNAINLMLHNNIESIKKIIMTNELGEIIIPDLITLESLLELNQNIETIDILTSIEPFTTKKISQIIPASWGIIKQK